MSRGRPCFEYGRAGRPIEQRPCGVTDGNLMSDWSPKVPDYLCENDSPCDRRFMVDLGSARRLTYLVGRGCRTFFDEIQASTDGVHWQTIVEDGMDVGDVHDVCATEIDVVARYVRLLGPAGGFYSSRRELSLF